MQDLNSDRRSNYQILDCIGTGNYSNVYKAIRNLDGTIVAIKVVDLTLLNCMAIENILNEIRILGSISNPQIVEYYEAFIDPSESFFWIIMEYLGGGDLAGFIKTSKKDGIRISEEQIWIFFVQILRGISALHKLKIIHRDIKPANIFITDDFKKVKIGDLNVSKILKEDLAKTQIGTPYYLAPEIWNMKSYDYKADIFSLGVTLYELAALKHPHEANNSFDLHRKLMNGVIQRIPSLYSEELNIVIQKCLILDEKMRPTTEQLLNSKIIKQKIAELYIYETDEQKVDTNPLLNTIAMPKKLSLLNKKLPQRGNSRTISTKICTSDNNTTNDLTSDSIKIQKTAKGVVKELNNVKPNLCKDKNLTPKEHSKGLKSVKNPIDYKSKKSSNELPIKEKNMKSDIKNANSKSKLSHKKIELIINKEKIPKKSHSVSSSTKNAYTAVSNIKNKKQDDNSNKLKSNKRTDTKPLVSDRANPPPKFPKNNNAVYMKTLNDHRMDKRNSKRASNQSLQKLNAKPTKEQNQKTAKTVKYTDYVSKLTNNQVSPKNQLKIIEKKRNSSTNRTCT